MLCEIQTGGAQGRWIEVRAPVVGTQVRPAIAHTEGGPRQKTLRVLKVTNVVSLNVGVGSGDEGARLRRGLVLPAHEPLDGGIELGNRTPGLADQHVARALLRALCLRGSASVDARLRRAL